MFHGHLDRFQKPPLGGRPNTTPGDHGTPNAHNRWFTLLYHAWRPTGIKIHWNSIWLRARSHMTSQLYSRLRDHTTWFWRCLGTTFGHSLLGSHNFMVTALGSCVKWPFRLLWFKKSACTHLHTLGKNFGHMHQIFQNPELESNIEKVVQFIRIHIQTRTIFTSVQAESSSMGPTHIWADKECMQQGIQLTQH
jgi:hypothetical protein